MISKKLKLAVIVASAVGMLVGCGPNNKSHHFNGMLDGEKVKFWEGGNMGNYNFLEVVRPDGRVIIYRDEQNDDLKIEEVVIKVEGKESKTYSKRIKVDQPIVEEAQKQFDEYLKKIFDYKQKEGMELIGKEDIKKSKGVYD